MCQGAWYSSRPSKCSKSIFGMPRRLDLLVDGALLVGDHLAGHQRRLAVDREGAAGLVDVGGLAHQAGALMHLRLAPAGHDHDLDPGALAGLQAARLGEREAALGVAEERAALAEQGAVEVGVDALQRHRWVATVAGCVAPRRSHASTWPSRSRPGSSTSPPTRCSRARAAGRRSRRSPTGWRWSRPGSTCSTWGRWRHAAGRPSRPRPRRRRWCPAIEGLAGSGVPVSADTFSVEVARHALAAGAVAVNDISGGSEEMFELVAESGCGYVLMHIEGPPRVDRPPREYGDVVEHLKSWFGGRVELAQSLGVEEEQIAIDPGLDFDLTTEQDLEILRRLPELRALGLPLYVSLSRKDFIGAVLAGSWESRWRRANASGGRSRRWRWRCAAAPTSSASTTAARCRRCASPVG